MCGTDLDTHRWDEGPGLGQRSASFLSALTHGGIPTWAIWALVIFAAAVVYGVIRV